MWPFILGDAWHNNHHANAKDWKQGVKWWEIDPTSWIIKIIKK
jgi:stearoyl-CoA desaturase (delta-9 desaturase)